MLKYICERIYNCQEIIIQEMINTLKDSNGTIDCMLPFTHFIETPGERPSLISNNWGWIQDQPVNKKLILLSEEMENNKCKNME